MNQHDKIRVLVLGDSSVSSLGCSSKNLFDYFSLETSYDQQLKIINSSIVGMTSADAWSNFKLFVKRNTVDVLMLYVGNCDACGYGFSKRKAPLWLGGNVPRLTSSLSKGNRSPGYSSLRLESPGNSECPIQPCVTPDDFRTFTEATIKIALKKNIRVILINPFSNHWFPPSNTSPNKLLYRIISIPEHFCFSKDTFFDSLLIANEHLNRSQINEAIAAYKVIITHSANVHLSMIAKNNLAYCYFRLYHIPEALETLDTIQVMESPYYPVILYNKAMIASAQNDFANTHEILMLALEADRASYRITSHYRSVLAALSKKYDSSINYVDAASVLTDNNFFDYCHPDQDGHKMLFLAVKEVLESIAPLKPGPHIPGIMYHSLNPDRFFGFKEHAFIHYKLVKSADKRFIETTMHHAEHSCYSDQIKKFDDSKLETSLRPVFRILRHPIFGMVEFLRASPPDCDADQGRFTEFYFLRHLLPICQKKECSENLCNLFNALSRILPDLAKLEAFMHEALSWCRIPANTDVAKIFHSLPLTTIESRLHTLLNHMVKKEPVVTEKYRTITQWFFRESLLFGTTSDYLMFCDRQALFDCATTCLFVLSHIENLDSPEAQPFVESTRKLTSLIAIHHKYLDQGLRKGFNLPEDALANYNKELHQLE